MGKEIKKFSVSVAIGVLCFSLFQGLHFSLSTVVTPKTLGDTYKEFNQNSIIMLIGDLEDTGPDPVVKSKLIRRIDLANMSGIDTVIICFRTSSVEDTFSDLDSIIQHAAGKDIAVIPRIIVNSKNFTEFIVTPDDVLPDYTNQTQLDCAVNLLRNVILHLEAFPNIVAYQIEWGHYGESWINSPFYNSMSSNSSFINYLKAKSPIFENVTTANFANWVTGDIMYYSDYLREGDPRREKINVASFYWYQEWRNSITLTITWAFRRTAKQLTQKPIIGFSYTGTYTISYVYSAQQYLDAAFCDATSSPFLPNKNFVRDAYFNGIHLGEMDFDTPYFELSQTEQAIAGTYANGIVPVIFYPLWSSALNDSVIPILANYMKEYNSLNQNPTKNQILLVIGDNDIGFNSYENDAVHWLASGPSRGAGPPGATQILESHGLKYDIIDPEVYRAEIGNAYKVVEVFVPRDTVDGVFATELEKTNASILIMHPSFMIGTPTFSDPTNTTSGLVGMQNMLVVRDREIMVGVDGTPPATDITFVNKFSSMGSIDGYSANYLFSHYYGSFDSVYAVSDGSSPTVAQMENIVFFGLDTQNSNQTQRNIIENFLIEILELCGMKLAHDVTITHVSLQQTSSEYSKTVVGQSYSLNLTVTTADLGNYPEASNVTVYANKTFVAIEDCPLPNGNSLTLTFVWNTTSWAFGNYTISAYAWPCPEETDTADNNYTCGIPVHLGVPGDISGSTQGVYDEKVDMRDISYLVLRFNTKPNLANWNPNADINSDATVNMRDISIAILNFNKHE